MRFCWLAILVPAALGGAPSYALEPPVPLPLAAVGCSAGLPHLPVTNGTELEWSLDVDGNCRVEALTDGLMVKRYQFGLRDNDLIAGAFDPAGQRTTADAIETYLAEHLCRTDMDDNGTTEPLIDGLLGERYLFGLRGAALIEGLAFGPGAIRITPEAIEPYIAFQVAKPCRALHFSLDYGPYRAGQSPGGDRPSTEEMDQDMAIMADETDLIRTYGSCAPELAEIPGLGNDQGLRLYQGLALGPTADDNDQEMACYEQLVQSGHENIVAAVVGGETLLRGDLTEAELEGYLAQAALVGLPVTTGETWFEWCNANAGVCQTRSTLANAVDFILSHSHPYWEGVPIDHAAAAVVAQTIALNALYPGKDVVVGETGWPSDGDVFGEAVPSLENQRSFIEGLWAWSRIYDLPILYFEAFDEAWKVAEEGTVGAHWGLYAEDRVAKHVGLDWSEPPAAASGFAASDLGEPPPPPTDPEVTIDHPAGNIQTPTKSNCGIPLFGRANVEGEVAVEVFTDQWYPQTLWYAGGRAPVVNGAWSMPEVILAGTGGFNDHWIRVRLYNAQGILVAGDEVQGIVRSNACTP